MEFFDNLDLFQKTLWYIALPVSVIFIVQAILAFIGLDSADSLDGDFDSIEGSGSSFQIFSFRNLINFLLGFSWTAISLYGVVQVKFILLSFSIIVGSAFVAFFFIVIRQLHKLAEDNTFKLHHTINKTGSVYLSIPERKTGKGKVQVSVKGAFHELDAITEEDKIETSAMVRIVKIENDLVIVEKL